MLIVVAIIAILIAISIPMVNSSLEKARKSTDQANVRAAKAAAVIEYMNYMDGSTTVLTFSGPTATEDTVYYSAKEGKIVDANPDEGYGKSSATDTGATGTPKDCDIEIKIKAADGTVTMSWI